MHNSAIMGKPKKKKLTEITSLTICIMKGEKNENTVFNLNFLCQKKEDRPLK